MKKRVMMAVVAIAMVSGTFAFAQNNDSLKSKGCCPKKGSVESCQKLNLTAEQQQKVDAINQKYGQMRGDMAKQRDAEMQKVLTKEQFQQMQQMRAKHMGSKGGKKGHGGINAERLAKELNLTDTQQKQLADIRAKYAKQRHDLMANGKSQENKQAMIKLRNEQRADVNKVLTQQQQDQLKQLKQQRAQHQKDGKMGGCCSKQKQS